MVIKYAQAANDARIPPTSWINPVPTRFLTPSTSVIILETSAPDLLLSK